jgi:hypothetical protein
MFRALEISLRKGVVAIIDQVVAIARALVVFLIHGCLLVVFVVGWVLVVEFGASVFSLWALVVTLGSLVVLLHWIVN